MNVLSFLNTAVRLAGPLILVSMGGLLASKVKIFNIALEAFMLIGCFASVVGAYYTQSVFGGIVMAVLCSVAMIMIFAVFILELKVEPVICAIAMITIASGLTRYLLIPIFHVSGRYILPAALALPVLDLPWLASIPVIGSILNKQSILVYFALICPAIIYVLLYKTKIGLSIRAVGLNAEAASAAGISPKRISYFALIINGILCGLGGAQLALALNCFNVGMSNGRGFTALATITLTGGHPILAALACLLFGISEAFVIRFSGAGYPTQLLSMLPYVMALLAAILPRIVKIIIQAVRRARAHRVIRLHDGGSGAEQNSQ